MRLLVHVFIFIFGHIVKCIQKIIIKITLSSDGKCPLCNTPTGTYWPFLQHTPTFSAHLRDWQWHVYGKGL